MGASALGKLIVVAALAATFLAGLIGVVYLSLRGEEVNVPEMVGKDFYESEREISSLGLKLKRRATRYSEEKPNTVLEQLPKAGETVKTGQTILVVLSEANPEGSESPATLKKDAGSAANTVEENDSTDITPDKPVKTNKNANVKKPAATTRDVTVSKPGKTADSAANNKNSSNSNSTDSKPNSSDANKNAGNKNGSAAPVGKPTPAAPGGGNKPEPAKPNPSVKPAAAVKTPLNNGDPRTRRMP